MAKKKNIESNKKSSNNSNFQLNKHDRYKKHEKRGVDQISWYSPPLNKKINQIQYLKLVVNSLFYCQ